MHKETVQLAIEGMTYDHCAEAIERALQDLPGVEQAAVSFQMKRADIEAGSSSSWLIGGRTDSWARTSSLRKPAR